MSTLICCALPALFVVLGAGATFASVVSSFPQLIWVSERKIYFILAGGLMLALAGFMQWNAKAKACPADKALAEACKTTRDWSLWIYFVSLGIYLVGAGFTLISSLLTS